MIIYNHRKWFDAFFQPRISLIVGIVSPSILVLLYSIGAFYFCLNNPHVCLSEHGQAILGTFVTFLLVFRGRKSYSRYWKAKHAVSTLCHDSRELVGCVIFYMRGVDFRTGDDHFDDTVEAMVGIVRHVIAFALSILIYTRIGWVRLLNINMCEEDRLRLEIERFRLKCLLSEKEFSIMDQMLRANTRNGGSSAQDDEGNLPRNPSDMLMSVWDEIQLPVVAAGWLRREVNRNINTPHGFPERIMNIADLKITGLMQSYQAINENITMPFPVGFSLLCKTLMLCFLAGCPFCIDTGRGIFANVFFPWIVSVAFFGIETLATELEMPFGEGDHDFNVLECVQTLECECLEMLLAAGDAGDAAAGHFKAKKLSESYSKMHWHLSVRNDMDYAVPSQDAGHFASLAPAPTRYERVPVREARLS